MLVKVSPALLAYSQSLSHFLKAQLQTLCYTESFRHPSVNVPLSLWASSSHTDISQAHLRPDERPASPGNPSCGSMEFTAKLNKWHSAVVLFHCNIFLTDPVGVY